MTRRRTLTAAAVITWTAVLGVAWLAYLGNQVGTCLGGPGMQEQIAACSAAFRAEHSVVLLESPLTWLFTLCFGYAVIWRMIPGDRPTDA